MALTYAPITYYVELVDQGGNRSTLRLPSNGDSFLVMDDMVQDIAANVGALTKAGVRRVRAVYEMVDPDLVSAGPDESEIENIAQISVALDTAAFPQPGQSLFGNIKIPAPINELFLAETGEGANIVDPTNAALQTFLQMFEAGIGILPALTLSDYQTIKDPATDGNVKGKRVHRKSSKG